MTEYERGAFDVFNLITSAWYGKDYYFPQDVHKNSIVYSRESGKYMPFEDALDEFLNKIGDDYLQARKKNAELPYPLTVTMDRYTGTYSGGKWTAWNCEPSEIPEGPFGDDVGCAWFWHENEIPVGLGHTPDSAIDDLTKKLEGESHE